jgi:hypothetical protein
MLGASGVQAREPMRDPPPTTLIPPRSSGPGLSADEAAVRAQHQYGGRVLAVRPEGSGYRVKLIKDGEVRVVFIGS